VGLDVGCHSLRHSSITQAAACGAQVGLGLDTIRAHSRHRAIGTLMLYVHAQRHTVVQRTLADLLAGTLTTNEHGRGAPGCVDAGGAEARRR
jgi:integrase